MTLPSTPAAPASTDSAEGTPFVNTPFIQIDFSSVDAWNIVFACIALAFGIGALAFIANIVMADGQIEYCYIDKDHIGGEYVWGFRPWRLDRRLAGVETIAEAKAATKAYGCELH